MMAKTLFAEPALLISNQGTIELLRKIEEISIRSSQGSGRDYLSVLQRVMPGAGETEALDRLKTVRLALARYIARCTITGSLKRVS
jgi:nuclear pore complex protein Nup85